MNRLLYFYLLLLGTVNPLFTASFVIKNHTDQDETFVVRMNKSIGSKELIFTIPAGRSHAFNTGIYGVLKRGISWDNGRYALESLEIDPTTTSLVITISQDEYEEGAGYWYHWVLKSPFQRLKYGFYPWGQ